MKKRASSKEKIAAKRAGIRTQIREHKVVFAVYVALRMIVIAALVLAVLRADYESAFICALVLVLFLLPNIIERTLRIDIPNTLEVLILLFIFAAEILGELQSYYIHFPYWDLILHTINGFVCAAFGFSLVDILCRNNKEKFNLSPLYMALVAFCFSMTVGVVWEFFEYGMDCFARTDMQKDTIIHALHTVTLDPTTTNTVISVENIQTVTVNGVDLALGGYLDIGLIDTMNDLFVNFIGAVVFSVIGFFYIKYRGKGRAGRIARHFIPTLLEENTYEQESTSDN